MIDKRKPLFVLAGLVLLGLVSCLPPTDRPWIRSITVSPNPAKEGGLATYAIKYQNLNEQQSFPDTTVLVTYGKHLQFAQDASPFPDEVNEKEHELLWRLGTLKPNTEGTIKVHLRLAARIPSEVYELKIDAEVAATGADGKRTRYQRSAITLIVGHPTPTPRPTSTPLPTPRLVEP
jgi:hypothetical protein